MPGPDVHGPPVNQPVDPETIIGEGSAEREDLIRLQPQINDFFEINQVADWVVIGDETGEVLSCGLNPQLPTEKTFRFWQREKGETLHLISRPDPNAPSRR